MFGLKKRTFLGDTLTLASGTVVGQFIGMLAWPVLTRLLTPSEIGTFGVYLTIFNILSPIAAGRFHLAIMLPKEDKKSFELLQLSIAIGLVFSLLLYIFLPWKETIFGLFFPDIEDGSWLVYSPLAVFLGSLFITLGFFCNRQQHFKVAALSKAIQVSTTVISQLVFSLNGYGVMGLIWGHLIGYFSSCFFMIRKTAAQPFREHKLLTETKKMWAYIIRYRDFMVFGVWGGLMNSLATNLPPLLFVTYYGTEEVGFLILTRQVVVTPLGLIGKSLSWVFFQRTAKTLNNGGTIKSQVELLCSKTILVSLLISMVLFFGGPFLFALVFGAKWVVSGECARILVPVFFFQFLIIPMSMVLIVLEKQRVLTWIQALLLLSTVISLTIGQRLYADFFSVLRLYAICMSISYMVYFSVIVYQAKASLLGILKKIPQIRVSNEKDQTNTN